jgi:hypothetical protein
MKMEVKSGENNTTYSTATFDFECLAADETAGLAAMWTQEDGQAAPAYMTAARGGIRIVTTVHGVKSIYHVTRFTFNIAIKMSKRCNDGDVGYTCVDLDVDDNMTAGGSIGFEDGSVTDSQILGQQLIVAARANLVLTVRQGGGATSKVITIAGVDFDSFGDDSSAEGDYDDYSLDFDVTNSTATPLTLDGTNKIITIADAA